jgi:hypothetical protein
MPIDWWAPMTMAAEASRGPMTSIILQYAAALNSLPPYSSGIAIPMAPSSPSPFTTSRGKKCSASIFSESMWAASKSR